MSERERSYYVHYCVYSGSGQDIHALWTFCHLGPFQNRATAEVALANLGSNPNLRGGEIEERK